MEESVDTIASRAFEQGKGIVMFRQAAWVPRVFCEPNMDLRLSPELYMSLGPDRGGIDERWFASTTETKNAVRPKDEGLSYIVMFDGATPKKVTLRDAVATLKGQLIGDRIWNEHKSWPVYTKFFNNFRPLGLHFHHMQKDADLTGQKRKPESYFFPPAYNQSRHGERPSTLMGFRSGVTKDMVRSALEIFGEGKGDNELSRLSLGYPLYPGDAWDIPEGIIHGPGTLCTWEPQFASDVFAFWEGVVNFKQMVPYDLFVKDCPVEKQHDYDFMVNMLDWELNTDPNFAVNRSMKPVYREDTPQTKEEGYTRRWVTHKSKSYGGDEVTIEPSKTVTFKDNAAYGFLVTEGHGKLGEFKIEAPHRIIALDQYLSDEGMVSEQAAKAGVTVTNNSQTHNLVLLRLFGPENPDMPTSLLSTHYQQRETK